MKEKTKHDVEYDEAAENQPGAGAEDGSESESADQLPGLPASDDDTPLGDTDQHSDA